MKKMKKLITLLLSLTMIFALCACGQTAEPKAEEPAKTDAPAADVAAADEPSLFASTHVTPTRTT